MSCAFSHRHQNTTPKHTEVHEDHCESRSTGYLRDVVKGSHFGIIQKVMVVVKFPSFYRQQEPVYSLNKNFTYLVCSIVANKSDPARPG